jgi:hypothetical protein
MNNKVRRIKSLPENLGEFELNLKQNTVYVVNNLLLVVIISFLKILFLVT